MTSIVDVLIAGNAGGTNVGASLHRAASASGMKVRFCDARSASAGPRFASTLSWRFLGHRPLHLKRFSASVLEECLRYQPEVLLTTGMSPVASSDLEKIGRAGVCRVNYSTDDPWNPGFRSRWFLDTLPLYDRVYTPRRANIEDFRRQGCREVHYLPFGYDESLWGNAEMPQPSQGAEVFFAGAAEQYRIECMRELAASGIRIAFAGDYWNRVKDLKQYALGHLSAGQLQAATGGTPISICFVRRANRDGHVMRSFEIPAIGACMLAEYTQEHREIFGEDGSAVRYFRSPREAAAVAKELLANPGMRRSLALSAHALIAGGGNTYRDRLGSMLQPDLISSTGGALHESTVEAR